MSVMISDNKRELIVTCKCGCKNAVNIKIDDEDKDSNYYALVTYLNGNWYRDQDDSILHCIGRKFKKIWAIIRNKDYYYSDILMSCDDFQRFKEYVNHFGYRELSTIENLFKIKNAVSRIEMHCEEKSDSNDYRLYDDIYLINDSINKLVARLENNNL